MHVPQDYGTCVEIETLMGVNKMIISPQASSPIMGVVQDALLGSYLLTQKNTVIPEHQFYDCLLSASKAGRVDYVAEMDSLFTRARKHHENMFTGSVLFSALFPKDFQYKRRNDASKEEPEVIIIDGVLVSGVIDKKIIGRGHGSVIHRLYKEYGCNRSAEFLSAIQFMVNRWLTYHGFSVGMRDFLITEENERGVEMAIKKAYIEVESIEKSNDPEELKEFRINNALNNRGQSLAINGLCKNNRLETMINSGSKGTKMNIIQIVGHLGQNNVEGRRIRPEIDDSGRTLPCFERGDNHPRTRGFIENSFLKGLSPEEFWFHAKAGREGVINTAVKTKESGYAERKLVKRMEDMTVHLDHTIRNSVNNIISFSYGDMMDPVMIYNNNGPSFVDIDNIVNQLNSQPEKEDENIVEQIRCEKIKENLIQSISEYKASIKRLTGRKDMCSKKMLKKCQNKLKELQAELSTLN